MRCSRHHYGEQVCFGAPSDFVTAGGTLASAGTLPDGSAGFIGLLPNCGASGATVCIQSRAAQLAVPPIGFELIVTAFVPEGLTGDPWGRCC